MPPKGGPQFPIMGLGSKPESHRTDFRRYPYRKAKAAERKQSIGGASLWWDANGDVWQLKSITVVLPAGPLAYLSCALCNSHVALRIEWQEVQPPPLEQMKALLLKQRTDSRAQEHWEAFERRVHGAASYQELRNTFVIC